MRFIFLSLFTSLFLLAQELQDNQDNQRVVKTSELELLLFKVGFQSLLTDVDITKDKSIVNEQNIQDLKDKVKIIMDEVYKDKRLLVEKSNSSTFVGDTIYKKEIEKLKKEIHFLKTEMSYIKNNKAQRPAIPKNQTVIINSDNSNVRKESNLNSTVLYKLNKGSAVELKNCNKFDWCEIIINDKKGYIAKFLLNL